MTISEAFRTKVFENYFKKKGLVEHQLTTFNDFLNHGIERIVRESSILMEYEDIKHSITFGEIYIGNPTIPEDDKYTTKLLYPNNARDMDLSYDAPVFVNVTEIIEAPNKPKEIKNHIRVNIARIPIMLGSCKCNLLPLSKEERIKAGECEFDQGGYFILDGKERVLVGQLRNIYNQPIVIEQKQTEKYSYNCEIRSMSEESGHSVQVIAKIGRDDRSIVFLLPYIKDAIPVGVVFKALGFLTDEEITEVIGCKEPELLLYVKYLLRDSYFIRSQEDALKFIGQTPLRVIKDEERTAYAAQVVENEIFPHMGVISTIKEKAYLLGDMVRKLLRTHVGLRKPDDRDNYCNKRVEMSGVLCFELFRTLFKKFTKNIQLALDKKKQRPDILSLISRNTSITLGLRHSFLVGAWGIPKASYIKKGVSQVLIRLSYASFISHLRRIAIQVGKDGKNANSKIRQIDGSQIFYISSEECFDPMMPILTFAGDIKLAKDIKVGDILIDDLGNPTRVRSTTSGIKNMYTINAVKRNYYNYKVTDNHILTLYINNKIQTRKRKPNMLELFWLDEKSLKIIYKSFDKKEDLEKFKATISSDNTVDITIEDYLKLSKSVKNYLTLYKVEDVHWPKQEVLIDPYILGLWLGDGISDGYSFACNDTEIIDAWMEWAENNNCEIDHKKRYRYHIKSNVTPHAFCNLIKYYNLQRNKHIPKEYLINDRETRLKLLAGFIDTDGNVRDNGHEIRICQGPKNEHMIEQLKFLAQSLGFICNVSSGKSQWTGPDGNKRYSTYKELTIRGFNLYEIPTRVERKKLLPLADEKVKRNQAHSRSKFELIKEGMGEFVGWQLEGNGRFLGGDFTVLHNTPEGASVGVVLNLALTSTVTTRISTTFTKEVIKNFDNFSSPDKFNENNYPKVFLNGVLIGITPNLTDFIKEIKINRQTGLLDKQISFSYNEVDNEIKIFSDEGRFIRPIFACNEDGSLRVNELDYIDQAESEQKFDLTEFTDDDGNINWQAAAEADKVVYDDIDFDNMVENQIIQYVDNNEIENSVVAMEPKELSWYKCNFCEITPIGMMGVIGSSIPFSEHIPAARTIFQSSMSKQAIGMYALSYNRRTDTTSHVLNYGQKPLISTKPAEIVGFHDMVYGTNAIVAIACYGGFNDWTLSYQKYGKLDM